MEEAAKDYDSLPEGWKRQYFEIELQRRYGISVTDLDENFGGKSTGGSRDLSPIISEESYGFPSSRVKNWDSLRKHVAEVLCFAKPVQYEYRIRRIRVSKPENEVKAYLKSMYKVDGVNKYACQMCHKPFPNVDMCQIADLPKEELDPMHLCLCPNCAAEYKIMRANETDIGYFLKEIKNLTNEEIDCFDPVEISFADETIWFTQTHIAEIRELMTLQEAADKYEDSPGKKFAEQPKQRDNSEAETVIVGTDVYKDYIGKRVYHTKQRMYGIVRTCDGEYIGIEFENGPKKGQVIKYSLQVCLSNGLITIV